MSGKKKQPTSRPKGRPPKGAPPALPAEEVDRLLVFGEVVTCDDGESQTVVYPSYRELAERFEVSTTLIAKYSKEHNCLRRRKQAKARIQAQADQKLVELRATAVALSKDDELRIIDGFLAGFEKALAEGRVRFDNPGDFNTMVRLKEFVLGGADSRQEIHAALSLEDIQARHQRMLRASQEASAEERGEIIDALPAKVPENADHLLPDDSPAPPAEDAAGEVSGQLDGDEENDAAPQAPTSRPSRDGGQHADDEASSDDDAPHGANVAPTAAPGEASAPAAGNTGADAGPAQGTR